MFGRNSNLSNFIKYQLPAKETTIKSFKLALNISTLHAAQKAFIERESSNKLKLAIRKNIQPSGNIYIIGDEVYYKRDNAPEWKGPGRVLGQNGPVVFICHRSHYIKAHNSQVQPITVNDSNNIIVPEVTTPPAQLMKPETKANEKPTINNEYESDDDSYSEGNHSILKDTETKDNLDRKTTDSADLPKVKRNNEIKFVDENNTTCVAKVINCAGKATGKYDNCYNIQYKAPSEHSGTKTWIDIKNVANLKIIQPELTKTDEILETQCDKFQVAKEKELRYWIDNDVYEIAPNENQKCISSRWVLSMEETPEGLQPKACLVICRFEENCLNKSDKESPTCSKDTLRTILAATAQNGCHLRSIDIKTAFLQGEKLDRNVFIKTPSESNCSPEHIWKLKK